jgi:hypothetical protein
MSRGMDHPFPGMMDRRDIQYTVFAPIGNGAVPENSTPASQKNAGKLLHEWS